MSGDKPAPPIDPDVVLRNFCADEHPELSPDDTTLVPCECCKGLGSTTRERRALWRKVEKP